VEVKEEEEEGEKVGWGLLPSLEQFCVVAVAVYLLVVKVFVRWFVVLW
jgi:hypothetical protein